MRWVGVASGLAVTGVCVVLVLGAAAAESAASCRGAPPSAMSDVYLSGVAASSVCNVGGVGRYGSGGRPGMAWKLVPGANPGGSSSGGNALGAVAATSSSNAWAVGSHFMNGGESRSLIEHWNGKAWKVQPSPNSDARVPTDNLIGVAARSSSNAWAVGFDREQTQTLIEHWNGKVWKVQWSPNPDGPGNLNRLFGVAATSSSNAWAVGDCYDGYIFQSVIEHWDGRAWTIQPSPNSGESDRLFGVTALSGHDAWAVGESATGTLIEHWDGTTWTVQPSPTLGGLLSGVAATSATNAWAVGVSATGTLIEHWDGTTWTVQPSPTLSGQLTSVVATSATNAWAVGFTSKGTLIEHWNGTAWTVQKSPNLPGRDFLAGVAATSSSNAWAVGEHATARFTREQTLIERWTHSG